jgi:hypothetical protein
MHLLVSGVYMKIGEVERAYLVPGSLSLLDGYRGKSSKCSRLHEFSSRQFHSFFLCNAGVLLLTCRTSRVDVPQTSATCPGPQADAAGTFSLIGTGGSFSRYNRPRFANLQMPLGAYSSR